MNLSIKPGNSFVPAGPLGAKTLELLWARIRQQGDMPGFAKAISAILGVMRGEDEHEFSMTKTVLSDPVLTQKVLRLANSGMYSAFGQRVNTVSRAVLVLGSDAIGHLALGLKLIEELSAAAPDSVSGHIEMEKALLAGMVAQQVGQAVASPDSEQAVVCAMLHTLGRMMLTFYMTDYWARMQAYAGPGNEAAAAQEILGLSLDELGRATAEHWGLPASLVRGMRSIAAPAHAAADLAATAAPDAAPAPDTAAASHAAPAPDTAAVLHAAPSVTPLPPEDWVAGLATLASQCADSLWHDDSAGQEKVAALVAEYAAMLGIGQDMLSGAIDKAKLMAAADLTLAPLSKPAERQAKAQASMRLRAEGNRILIAGLAEMRAAAATGSPGQMMSMALESIYKGLDFSRAVGFIRNRRGQRYAARLGLGQGVQELLPQLQFDEAYEPNVFHAALNSDRVIFIDNARDPKFAAKLPAWWKASLSAARSFVILPLHAHGQPAGFIYGDWDDSAPPLQLNQTEFALLNDMRALVVDAVESRHQLELAASKSA